MLGESASANTCTDKELKDCVAISAKRRFLDWTPVCVMEVECDAYCGSLKFDKQRTTFYCKFQSVKGDDYACMPVSKCANDTSVVKSEKDIERLTRNPVSPGSGVNLPQEKQKGTK